MNNKRNPIVKNVLTLCVSVLLVIAVLGLCFVGEWGISRAFLLAGGVICTVALSLRAIMVEKGSSEVVYVERNVSPDMAVEAAEVPDEPSVPENTSEPVMPASSESQSSLDKDVKEDELELLVKSLGENYVNAFEDELDAVEDFEQQKDRLMERFLDIALLCMDFVKPNQEDFQKNYTKGLILKKLTKEDLLSLLSEQDSRLSRVYRNLSRLLKSLSPDKSFYYSGYKL